jgi:hypothetical protein
MEMMKELRFEKCSVVLPAFQEASLKELAMDCIVGWARPAGRSTLDIQSLL